MGKMESGTVYHMVSKRPRLKNLLKNAGMAEIDQPSRRFLTYYITRISTI